jgi:hypothetical protein
VSRARDPYQRILDLIAAQPGTAGAEPGDVVERLQRLCGAAAVGLSASGVGISVLAEDGKHGIFAASDENCERLEELQFVLGEGPCIDALRDRRPVLVSHLDDEAAARWPAYAAEVHACGARAVFAFPLQIGAAQLGVLDVFRAGPGPLSTTELTGALLFADVAVSTLLDGQADAPLGLAAAGLVDQVAHRAELFQAQGMVMVQLGVGLAEALARIRAYTFAQCRPLHDVARDIVHRRIRLDRDSPAPDDREAP